MSEKMPSARFVRHIPFDQQGRRATHTHTNFEKTNINGVRGSIPGYDMVVECESKKEREGGGREDKCH